MKYRPIYFAISGVAVAISIYAIVAWGFKLSIDFTGGTIVEYQFPNEKREISGWRKANIVP